MNDAATLQRWSRLLLALTGIMLVFTGLSFYLLPEYSALNFPWLVSPLVAMTIGSWALGMGLMALNAVRGWDLSQGVASLVAIWTFCLFELVVVAVFAVSLRLGNWLTWPYLIALGLGSASAVVGLFALWLRRTDVFGPGVDYPRWMRATYAAFAIGLIGLGLVTLLVTPTGGSVFPELLGAFTTRAFSAFFFALALGALMLLRNRDVVAAASFARTGLYLVVFVLAATLSYLDLFDFGARPGGLIYIGAYLVTAIVAGYIVVWDRRYTSAPTFRQ